MTLRQEKGPDGSLKGTRGVTLERNRWPGLGWTREKFFNFPDHLRNVNFPDYLHSPPISA